jgi:hypothetical protein
MSPEDSDDLTEMIACSGNEFIVYRSSDAAGHKPDYHELGRFPTLAAVEAFLAGGPQSAPTKEHPVAGPAPNTV